MFEKIFETPAAPAQADGFILDDSAGATIEIGVAYITWRGVTVGDRIAFRDTNSTGTVKFEHVFATANGFERVPFREDCRPLRLAGRGWYTEMLSGGTVKTFIRG